ncbi:MAG: hypothetical protein ACI4SG_03930 [Oligosphaeraceae bacterium]
MEIPVPVIQEADVLLVGGTLPGCSLAPRLRRARRRVVMVCEDTALGTDCAGVLDREVQKGFPELGSFSSAPHCQAALRQSLEETGVHLIFGAYPVKPVRDAATRRIAGWIFLGERGFFAIAAKAVVDTTRGQNLFHQAHLLRRSSGMAPCRLHWNLLGSARQDPAGAILQEVSLTPAQRDGETLPLCHCQCTVTLREDDLAARLEADSSLRMSLWHEGTREGASWSVLEIPGVPHSFSLPTLQTTLFSWEHPCLPILLQATSLHVPPARQFLTAERPPAPAPGTQWLPMPPETPPSPESPGISLRLDSLARPGPHVPLVILGAGEAGRAAAIDALRRGVTPLLLEESGLPRTSLQSLREAGAPRLWLHCRPAGLLRQDQRLTGLLVLCATGESLLISTPQILDTRTPPNPLP